MLNSDIQTCVSSIRYRGEVDCLEGIPQAVIAQKIAHSKKWVIVGAGSMGAQGQTSDTETESSMRQ